MIVTAFVLDANSGATIARFGLEQEPGDYRPERWALAKSYIVPAPAGHSWGAWAGALVMLLATFGLIVSHV